MNKSKNNIKLSEQFGGTFTGTYDDLIDFLERKIDSKSYANIDEFITDLKAQAKGNSDLQKLVMDFNRDPETAPLSKARSTDMDAIKKILVSKRKAPKPPKKPSAPSAPSSSTITLTTKEEMPEYYVAGEPDIILFKVFLYRTINNRDQFIGSTTCARNQTIKSVLDSFKQSCMRCLVSSGRMFVTSLDSKDLYVSFANLNLKYDQVELFLI